MHVAPRRAAATTLAVAGGVVLLRPGTPGNRLARRQLDAAARQLRYLGGRLRGVSYRLRGGHPDPDVPDAVLADRVRSSLGGLEKRLDVPHVHVTVEGHVVLLHGEVGTEADAAEIEAAVEAVAGVVGVESYLHIGLGPGDTRPSVGREVHPPSATRQALLDAAVGAGVRPESAAAVVRSILAAVADRLPEGERDQVAGHLPSDVRPLFTPPRRAEGSRPPSTVAELVSRIAATTGELPRDQAEPIVTAVMRALRAAVPEEAGDVAATLPSDLQALWEGPP